MDALDPQWEDDPGMKAFDDFLAEYFPKAIGPTAGDDWFYRPRFGAGAEAVRRQPHRENVMKQAANLKDFRTTNLLPGITMNTSPTDFAPIKQLQFRRFKGDRWELFGPVLNDEIGG